MQLIRWQGEAHPQEQDLRKRMQTNGLSPYSWSNGPGEQYAVHSHNYQKVLYCARGSIRFKLPDHLDGEGNAWILNLEAGDCLILPAHIRHSAEVGTQGVTCLEAAQYKTE